MPTHHAMMYNGRIHQLLQYSGPQRGFDQVAYESESDSSESDMRGHIASQNNQQRRHDLFQNHHQTSTASCFAHVSQATPRENTQALRGSISSGPSGKSSGGSSDPPSPWGSGETKQRTLDTMKNELSDIHLLIGYKPTTGCGINYARIQKMYAPKHGMSKFCPIFERLRESKKKMAGPFKETAKKSEPWYISSKKTSLGYTPLHDMYPKQSSIINPVTAEEI